MLFYALTSDHEGDVETWALKARVLPTPRGLADVNISENHVWLLILHKVIFTLENLGKTLQKVHFALL